SCVLCLWVTHNCSIWGGCIIKKSNVLIFIIVIASVNTLSGFFCDLAINCLQNSIMLTPAAPKAGPTGGDGFAAPPLTCSLTTLLTSFAIVFYFSFFNF